MRTAAIVIAILLAAGVVRAGTDPRIPTLVEQLDKMTSALSVAETDPIAKQLIDIGEPAVDALIDVIAWDQRMTRATFDRESELDKPIVVPVYVATYIIVERIISTSFFSSERYGRLVGGHRAEVVAELRAHWAAVRKFSHKTDRWFAILADDAGAPADWVDAAGRITGPTKELFAPDRHLPVRDGIRGEDLRSHGAVGDRADREADRRGAGRRGLRVDRDARALGLGDRVADRALADGARVRADRHDPSCTRACRRSSSCAPRSAIHRDRRIPSWLATTVAPDSYVVGELEPLGAHADRPAAPHAAEILFGGKSPWLPPVDLAHIENSPIRSWIALPLYGLAGFRAHLAAALVDTHVVATVVTAPPRAYRVTHADWTNGYDIPDDAPVLTAVSSQPVRVCDFYAHEIGLREGAPKLELYWPLARRTAAIKAQLAWLATLGRRP